MAIKCFFFKININNSKFRTFAVAGFENCNDVFPIYIGDDKTDEDAFKVYNSNDNVNNLFHCYIIQNNYGFNSA